MNTSSTDDNDDEIQTKKIKITDDKKHKFELLKQKRLQIKQNYDLKQSKKRLKIEQSKTNEPIETVVHLPTTSNDIIESDIKQINKELNSALKSNDIESSERLSDRLAIKQAELKANKASEIIKSQLDHNLKKKTDLKRLKWTFEPKKRWETKSNM